MEPVNQNPQQPPVQQNAGQQPAQTPPPQNTAGQQQAPQQEQQPYQPPYSQQQPYQQPYQQQPYPPQQPPYPPYQQTDNTAKVICILDYFSVLCLLGLFVEKDNPDVRFHTNQGLILFLLEAIICVVSAVLGWIPIVGFIVRVVCSLLGLVCIILSIVGIINASQNQRRPLPLVGTWITLIK